MGQTLAEYIADHDDWDELPAEKRLNVVMTFVMDLETEVDRLERRVKDIEEYGV